MLFRILYKLIEDRYSLENDSTQEGKILQQIS